MTNFTLKFGKYKGEQFANTPKSYQEWLISQDWFKIPEAKEVRYNVVRKFVPEYRRGMGVSKEIVFYNLTWEEAVEESKMMNIHQINDITDYYYAEPTIQ